MKVLMLAINIYCCNALHLSHDGPIKRHSNIGPQLTIPVILSG
jgi:hypothetical protein